MSTAVKIDIQTRLESAGFLEPSFIGEGSNGVIYRCIHQGQVVALKLLKGIGPISTDKFNLFQREISSQACINHSGIVRVFDCGKIDQDLFIVTEFIEGRNLQDIIRDGRLDPEFLIQVAKSVAGALTAIHQIGFVHRDIKPGNVMVSKNKTIKLIDFGLLARTSGEQTESGAIVGTLRYASPEQLGLVKSGVDGRSDLYALGMVLYHCALGRPAFEDTEISELMQKHLKVTPASVNLERPEIHPVLSAIIDKLIAKSPEDRYDNAAQLSYDLEHYDELLSEYESSKVVRLGRKRIAFNSSTLFGRDSELAILRDKWTSAKSSKGSLSLVIGESGTGKTRLVNEILGDAEAEGALIFKGKNEEGGAHPLGALHQILDEELKKLKKSDEGLFQRELENIKFLLRATPAISRRLSLQLKNLFSDEEVAGQPEFSDEQYVAFVSEFFSEYFVSKKKNCIIFIDDLQWLSTSAFSVLSRVAHNLKSKNILIVATGRSESAKTKEYADLLQGELGTQFVSLEIRPLSEDFVGEMIGFQLGQRKYPFNLRELVYDRSKGNPFLVEQYIKSMIDSCVVALEKGEWKIDQQQMLSLPLPGNITELMLSRLEKLDSDSREFLSAASIFGIEFNQKIVMQMLGWDQVKVTAALQDAMRGGLISSIQQDQVAFAHDKIIESLQVTLSGERKRELHTSALWLLVKSGYQNVLELAKHVLEADISADKTAAYGIMIKAADDSFKSSSNEQAKTFYLFASNLMEEVKKVEDRPFINEMLGKIYRRLGDSDKAIKSFEAAILEIKNPLKLGQLYTEIANIYVLIDLNLEKAWTAYKNAVHALGEPFPEKKGPPFVISILKYFARIAWAQIIRSKPSKNEVEKYKVLAQADRVASFHANFTNRPERMILLSIRSWFGASRLKGGPESANAYSFFTLISGVLGKTKWVEKFGKKALTVADQLNDPFLRSRIQLDYAMSYHMAGQLVKAEELVKQLLDASEKWMYPEDYFRMISDILTNYLLRGYSKEVLRFADLGIRKANLIKSETRKVIPFAFASAALSLSGKNDIAQDSRKKAIESWSKSAAFQKNPFATAMATYGLLFYYIERNDFDSEVNQAIKDFENFNIPAKKSAALQKPAFMALAMLRLRQFEQDQSAEVERNLLNAISNLKLASKNPQMKCYLYLIEGSYFLMKKNLKLAVRKLKASQVIAESIDSQLVIFEVSCQFARIAGIERNFTKLKGFALLAWDVAHNMGWASRAEKVAEEFRLHAARAGGQTVTVQSGLEVFNLSSKKYSEALQRVSQAVSGVIDPDEQARLALDQIIELLHAERGFFFNADKETGELKVQVGRNEKKESIVDMAGYSRTVVEKVHKTKEPVIVVMDESGEYSVVESIMSQGLKSIIAVPMYLRSEYVGIAYFDSNVVKGLFSKADLEICRGIGSHIAVAQEMAKAAVLESQRVALQKDLELTGTVQSLFFPKSPKLKTSELELVGYCAPATICSGDWWWYETSSQGHLQLIATDVMGHGAPSAMVTAAIASSLRARMQGATTDKISDILRKVNDDIATITRGEYYSTLVFVEVDTGANLLRVWNHAGPAILILDSKGNMEICQSKSSLIGVEPEAYGVAFQEYPFNPGDRFCLFSDGLFEVKLADGRDLGLRRVTSFVKKTKTEKPEAAINQIIESVKQAAGVKVFDDDATIIIIDRT